LLRAERVKCKFVLQFGWQRWNALITDYTIFVLVSVIYSKLEEACSENMDEIPGTWQILLRLRPGLLVEWLTRLTYNPKRVSERVRSRGQGTDKNLWIRGSVGGD
jgi:hypothetical protein